MLGPLLLFVCAFLWGTSFVAQKASTQRLGPFAVIFARGVLAAAFLFVWAKVAHGRGFTRTAWIGGALTGFMLFVAMLAQQIGIASTTPGISAFLTSNYILIVPVLGLFVGRPTHGIVWIGAAVALVGSYFICIDPSAGFSIGRGELWTLLCAFLFAMQILCIDRYAPKTDALALSCVAQIAIAVLSAPFLLLESEKSCCLNFLNLSNLSNFSNLSNPLYPILYLGIVSSGIAYTLQNLGQRRTPPTLATIVMSLEAVFGALSGYVWYGDVLMGRQFAGCALLFAAATVTPILIAKRK